MVLKAFNPKKFVESCVKELRKSIGDERALIAVSGGIDSVTCAVLTCRAVGKNAVCVMLDNGFMREGEPEQVAEALLKEPFNLSIKIIDVRERFLSALTGLRDAEEKRKAFREAFYLTLGEVAKKEGCSVLVQGTIKADVIETVDGVKTQHNVLEQIGINPVRKYGFRVIEPISTLRKDQVRMIARYLGLPAGISERQPFPGPGLSVRAVGEIRLDKLETLRRATAVVEAGFTLHKPSQCFAAIIDDEEQHVDVSRISEAAGEFFNVPLTNVHVKIFKDRATGIKGGKRCYGEIVGVEVRATDGMIHQAPVKNLIAFQAKVIAKRPAVTRVLYAVKHLPDKGPYVIAIRAVQTEDFLTAQVSDVPWGTLNNIAEEVIKACPNVSTVYYDVTPKPPATIEME